MAIYDEHYLHDFPDRVIRYLLRNPHNLKELVQATAPNLAPCFDFSRTEGRRGQLNLQCSWSLNIEH